jgi:prolyl 4-hydroxylase
MSFLAWAFLTAAAIDTRKLHAAYRCCNRIRHRSHCCAFAGGGFGPKASRSSKEAKHKNDRIKSLKEIYLKTLDQQSPKSSHKPQLDKWGLPTATIDDIFPCMPPETELLPIDKEGYSLKDIQELLKNHMVMQLDQVFDEEGVERNAPLDRPPMKLRLLHRSPPVLVIDNFLTTKECLEIEYVAMPPPAVVSNRESDGKKAVEVGSATFSPFAQAKRTSTSWFCHYSQVPVLLSKARYRLGVSLEHMEEPQIVRYEKGQEFSWHYDEVPRSQLNNGGQRLATLLVYLNSMTDGGGTIFRDLKGLSGDPLSVQPFQGSALLFFPAFIDGRADDRTLHRGEKIILGEKRIVQLWIHERAYRAVLPPGNSQKAASEAVEHESRVLGYI